MALRFGSTAASPDGLRFGSTTWVDLGGTPYTGTAVHGAYPFVGGYAGAEQDPNGITANDTWTEPVSIELVQDVSVGTLVLELNGLFTYTPPAEFVGEVTFQYRLWESGQPSNIGTVTITVEGDYVGTAVHGSIPLIAGVSQLIAGFAGEARHSALALQSHAADLAAGFNGVSVHSTLPTTSTPAQLMIGFAGEAQHSALPLVSYAAILDTSVVFQDGNTRIFHSDKRSLIWRHKMDIIDIQEKTAAEDMVFDFDFSEHPAIYQRGAVIDSVTSVTADVAGLTIGAPVGNGAARAQVRISGGTNKVLYILTCQATTDQGDDIETHGRLYVANPE